MQDRGQNLLRGFDAHRRWSCVRALEIGTAVREQTAVVVQRPYRRPTPVPNSLTPAVESRWCPRPHRPSRGATRAAPTAEQCATNSECISGERIIVAGRPTDARARPSSLGYAFAFGPGRPCAVRGGNPGRVRGAVETGLRRCARAAGAVVHGDAQRVGFAVLLGWLWVQSRRRRRAITRQTAGPRSSNPT